MSETSLDTGLHYPDPISEFTAKLEQYNEIIKQKLLSHFTERQISPSEIKALTRNHLIYFAVNYSQFPFSNQEDLIIPKQATIIKIDGNMKTKPEFANQLEIRERLKSLTPFFRIDREKYINKTIDNIMI